MNFSRKDTVSADELQAVMETIPGITVLANSTSDRGVNLFLFEVDETLEGWSALRLLRTVTQQDADGSERMAHLSLADSNTDDPNFRLYWELECCPICGLLPGEVVEALKAHGYDPVEPADEEVEGS